MCWGTGRAVSPRAAQGWSHGQEIGELAASSFPEVPNTAILPPSDREMPRDGGSQPKELREIGQMQLEKPWPCCLSRDLLGTRQHHSGIRLGSSSSSHRPDEITAFPLLPAIPVPAIPAPWSLQGGGCCSSLTRGRTKTHWAGCACPRAGTAPSQILPRGQS